MAQVYNSSMVRNLATHFPKRTDVALAMGNLESLYLNLPGLRCRWNFAHMKSTSVLTDLVNGMNMTNVNTVTSFVEKYVTYGTFNGSNQYLWRADEAELDILGLETYIAAAMRGFTVGCWCRPHTGVGTTIMMTKGDAATNLNFRLMFANTIIPMLRVSNTGAAWLDAIWPTTVAANQWHFIVGRFIPSTSIMLYVDGEWEDTGAAAPVSLFNSTAPLTIGAYRTAAGVVAQYLDGDMAFPFMCAAAVPDRHIFALYELTKTLFR